MRLWTRVAVLALCCAAPAALAESVYSFDSISAGQVLPFSLSVNGLTASFNGSGAVCPTVGLNGNMFVSLTGNAIVQGFCGSNASRPGPLTITFSGLVGKVTFAVALNGTSPVPVTVTYLRSGATVGTQTIQPAVPNGSLSPEAVVTYAGGFDSISISSTALLAVDNLDAVPVPSAGR